MESLSIQMQPFFEWLLRTTLQASLLICLILSLQTVLRSRLGVRWHYGLWLVLLLRMAMPWTPESRVSVFNLLPQSIPQRQFEHAIVPASDMSADSIVVSADTSESTPISDRTVAHKKPEPVTITPQPTKEAQGPAKSTFPKFVAMFPLVWLTGALVLAVYICASNFYLWWLVTRERPLTDQKILDLLEDCKSRMGIRTILGVVTTDKVKSPALFGFVRPRLLLPEGMIETLSEQELRYVLLHELAHLKRHDIYIGWLVSLLQILHWFNPLVWLAFYRLRSDRELACDALVLARTLSEESKSYGRIIVNLVERFSRPRCLPGMAGILETKAQLKRRVTMITRFKKNSYQWSPLAVILIIILACVCLPDAVSTRASQTSTTKAAPPITLRRIWSNSYPVTDGEPSPDGRYLSYTDWETGDLAVYEIATGTKRRLTNKGTWDDSDETAYSSRWSTEGEQIVYSWEMGPDSVELRLIKLDGSEPRILYRTDEQHRWVEPCGWFPDGKHILASLTGKDGTDKIVRISVENGLLHVLKTVGKDCLGHARLSPDGQYIAYDFKAEDNDNSSNLDISLISLDGSDEISLIKHPAIDFVLGWVPDGKNILFASDRTGTLGIWMTAVIDGKPQGDPKLVKQIVDLFEPLGFTKDGSYYYGTSKGSDDIFVATLDQKTGKIIAPLKKAIQRYEGSNMTAAYSPDGKYLAFIYRLGIVSRNRNRRNILCIRSLETGKEQEFPLNLSNIRRHSSPRWSPDGRFILVSGSNQPDRLESYRINLQTGEAKYLVQSPVCEWSADGKAIFYVAVGPKPKGVRILFQDLYTGQKKELYRGVSGKQAPYNISLSPDGQLLAIRCISPTSLKITPASGGQARELAEFEKVATIHKPIAWTADSQYIIFSGNEPGGGKHPLYRISAETGKTEKLGLQMNRYYGLSTHPDGRHILISGREDGPESEVWVMENFLPTTIASAAK